MSAYTFTMHVTSEDSKTLHTGNKPYSFYVIPPYPLQFVGDWKCCVECVFCEVERPFTQPLCMHVILDCVEPCIAYGQHLRIAATSELKQSGSSHMLTSTPIGKEGVKVDTELVDRIKVDLVDNTLDNHLSQIKKAILLLRFTRE